MTSTVFTAEIFQIGAGLSGYVAEIGSAFLCADLGIVPELEPRPDHATYLGSWLTVLANDKRAIFSAAAHAQRAVTYLHGLQPQAETVQEAAA
jgi:antirestriction protein ArdC